MTRTNTYCIYSHQHPETGEEVYLGIGRFMDRAYDYRSRKFKHKLWIRRLLKAGYYPSDYVVFVQTDLSEADAVRFEKQYIQKHRPKYNIQHK